MREAGANAVQELAFTFAHAIAYIDSALERSLAVDDFAKQISFFFNVHSDFFEEICKFRAARRIWAKLTRERYGAKDPQSSMLRFHAQTAGSTLTAQQPQNNVVRVSLQALAAVLGGTQSLHTNSLDEALALPTEGSSLLALRTQQIIAYESNVIQTADPLAGSYFIETLTTELESRVWDCLSKIEEKGGAIRCIENGYFQKEISNSAYLEQKKIDSGEQKIVGVNSFNETARVPLETHKSSFEIEKFQIQKLIAFRRARNQLVTDEGLRLLREGIVSGDNLQNLILHAVKCQATLGEISATLSSQFGFYQDRSGF